MDWKATVLVAVVELGFASVAGAAGGTVRPATSGRLDYVYVENMPPGTNDRAIVRYGIEGRSFPNGSEFDPNTILCGARTRSGHQSGVSEDRPELLDIRLEDPNNPAFPNVLSVPATPGSVLDPNSPYIAVGADSNETPIQCPVAVSYQNYTFNSGAGIPDPQVAVFLTWRFTGHEAPCYLGLELFSAPYNGRARYYSGSGSGGTFGCLCHWAAGGNFWLEMVAFSPNPLDVNFRIGGAPQFAGDRGLPLWFIRGDEAGTCVDDFISTTIVVDNFTGVPFSNQIVSLVGDRRALNPKSTPRDFASVFRLVDHPRRTLASGNPYSWSPGRTVLRANIPSAINGRLQARLPANLPFTARTGPPSPPGPEGEMRRVFGARRHRGQIDDGSAEIALIVQSPVVTWDALAQRFPAVRLFPTCAGSSAREIFVTRIDINAASNGGAGGFDAVQLRRADPVILDAADQTPDGLLGGTGQIGDGIVDVPVGVDPNGQCSWVSLTQSRAIRVTNADDVWANAYPFPGDVVTGATYVCEDTSSHDTILGQSFTTPAGAQPYLVDPTGNWMIRLVFTPGSSLSAGDGAFAELANPSSRRVPLRVAGEIPTLVLRQQRP